MAFMKYFEKDLLKWHNMIDISYVLMFLIFILQGIFLYKNPLTYHKVVNADVKLQINLFNLTCQTGKVVFGL